MSVFAVARRLALPFLDCELGDTHQVCVVDDWRIWAHVDPERCHLDVGSVLPVELLSIDQIRLGCPLQRLGNIKPRCNIR